MVQSCPGDGCRLQPLPQDPDGRCVLHSTSATKSLSEFATALKSHLSNHPGDFRGIAFPSGYRFDPESKETATGSVSFEGASFDLQVDFRNAVFLASVNFRSAKFARDANFSGAVFLKGSNGEGLDFHGTVFEGNAYFYRAVFRCHAGFSGVTFGKVDQQYVANFIEASFEAGAEFRGVSFRGDAYFNDCHFRGPVDFHESRFFRIVTFIGPAMFEKREVAQLTSLGFEKPGMVYFDSVDLSGVSLLRTDLRGVNLTQITWRKRKGRYILWDEEELRMEEKELKRSSSYTDRAWLVEDAYRGLKSHYELQRDYAVAGHFHYGEMEMWRIRTSIIGAPALWLYCWLSGYGERAGRAFLWLVVIWIGFACLYFLTQDSSACVLQRVLAAADTSVRALTRQSTEMAASIAVSIEGILGPVQTGLLILALRRRFRR